METSGPNNDTIQTDRGPRSLIALVDDDASIRRSIANLFGSLGFDVQTFVSAEDFLESNVEATQCLVLDIQLPGMSGLDLLERLTLLRSGIRVVMLTAHGNDETRRRAVKLGAAAVLSKPFRSEDLVRAVMEGAI